MSDLTPDQIAGINDKFRELYYYGNADKAAVVNYIKNSINGNGYMNTHYATQEAVKGKTFEMDGRRDAFYESVSAMLVNTGKYTRELNKDPAKGYNVLLNPAYFNNRSIKINSWASIAVAGAAAFISLLGYLNNVHSNATKEYMQQRLNIESRHLEQGGEILHSALQRIDQLDRRIQEIDSFVRK
jgi:hypothetical protein